MTVVLDILFVVVVVVVVEVDRLFVVTGSGSSPSCGRGVGRGRKERSGSGRRRWLMVRRDLGEAREEAISLAWLGWARSTYLFSQAPACVDLLLSTLFLFLGRACVLTFCAPPFKTQWVAGRGKNRVRES